MAAELRISSHPLDEAEHCADACWPPSGAHHPEPSTEGHWMHVVEGGVSLHADHRSVAMVLPALTTPLRRLDMLAGLPQLLLAGSIVAAAVVPTLLERVCNAMPASYALEALQQVGAHPELTYIALRDIVVVVVFAVASLCLAAAALRRRTP
nr:hypothetical protein [Mycobacterium pseudoshottsii]